MLQNRRFVIVEASRGSWFIQDTQCEKWNLPVYAVTIHFGTRASALAVADLINKEWRKFLANPT